MLLHRQARGREGGSGKSVCVLSFASGCKDVTKKRSRGDKIRTQILRWNATTNATICKFCTCVTRTLLFAVIVDTRNLQ